MSPPKRRSGNGNDHNVTVKLLLQKLCTAANAGTRCDYVIHKKKKLHTLKGRQYSLFHPEFPFYIFGSRPSGKLLLLLLFYAKARFSHKKRNRTRTASRGKMPRNLLGLVKAIKRNTLSPARHMAKRHLLSQNPLLLHVLFHRMGQLLGKKGKCRRIEMLFHI